MSSARSSIFGKAHFPKIFITLTTIYATMIIFISFDSLTCFSLLLSTVAYGPGAQRCLICSKEDEDPSPLSEDLALMPIMSQARPVIFVFSRDFLINFLI